MDGLLGRSASQAAPAPALSREAWLAIPDAVACPRCGAIYVGESCSEEEPAADEDQGWEAIDRLAAECPNHVEYFVVGI
jgi:hypothetical protein